MLDSFCLTEKRFYLEKAEELIRRCVHPTDDPAELELYDIERRWSYLVFLQSLGRYLGLKVEREELDPEFDYARASLDHYARWMLEHEQPYSQVLDRVEFPTETWPAHDFRKSSIFDLASMYGRPYMTEAYREKAAYYFDAAMDALAAFETCGTLRAMAICLSVSGVRGFFDRQRPDSADLPAVASDFEAPTRFVPQKERIKSLLSTPSGFLRVALFLMRPTNLAKILRRRIW